MHEIGHNFGLHHGGDPNYNSLMNYRYYQFDGIDSDDCNVSGDQIPDYSSGNRITLNEDALDENAGICGITANAPTYKIMARAFSPNSDNPCPIHRLFNLTTGSCAQFSHTPGAEDERLGNRNPDAGMFALFDRRNCPE